MKLTGILIILMTFLFGKIEVRGTKMKKNRVLLSSLLFLLSLTSTPLSASPAAYEKLRKEYELICATPSDVHDHLPVLRNLASECSSVTEIGMRSMVTSWALLQGLSDSTSSKRFFLGIDLRMPPEKSLNKAKRLSKKCGMKFMFWQTNDMDIYLPSVDLLFIDSLHTYCHLTYELETFATYVNKYIAMHDTSYPCEYIEDSAYHGDYSEYSPEYDRTKKGLWPAVEDFLTKHPEWVLHQRYYTSYGLTILKRVK